jgi:hypothetical protein
MRINRTKRTSAQKRKREMSLLAELCADYGYAFADSLPSKDRLTMMMITKGGKRTVVAAPAIKMVVPSNGYLGRMITNGRKERDPATNRSARARARAREREKAKV